jgi:hypothetical protein
MKVNIKEFGLDLNVKNKGMTLDIYTPNGKTHLGDVKINKSGLTWCKGKSHTGKKMKWATFIEKMTKKTKKTK